MRRLLTMAAIATGLVVTVHTQARESDTQPPATRIFADLQRHLRPGDVVQVREVRGGHVAGRVVSLTATTISIRVRQDERRIAHSEVERVDRVKPDSAKNGAWIGLAAGMALGYPLGRRLDSPRCPASGSECGQGALIGVVNGAMLGAAGGWLADRLIKKREPIYIAPGAP